MARAARIGDVSFVQADSHGCPSCSHSASGPATTASSDVAVNHRRALRRGDAGVHASCCGPNTWVASDGAPRVLINHRAAHRLGDPDVHCGGVGAMVSASSNVLIGDFSGEGGRSSPLVDVAFLVVDLDEVPVSGATGRVMGPDGVEYPVVTGANGRVILRRVKPGLYRIQLNDGSTFSENLRPLAGEA